MSGKINVTVWNEFLHEKENPKVAEIYPDGIHNAIADALKKDGGINVKTATLDEPNHGLTDEVLDSTDVLFWWGHKGHSKVDDTIVEKVYNRVNDGMGLVVLHSGHASKIFSKLMGTPSRGLKWREDGKLERLWVINPAHPIAAGIDDFIEVPQTEMYGEQFVVPEPDETVFISWFEGGEVFRSGITYRRGLGKVFYFRPGHETFPIYHQKEIRRVLINAAYWAVPQNGAKFVTGHYAGIASRNE